MFCTTRSLQASFFDLNVAEVYFFGLEEVRTQLQLVPKALLGSTYVPLEGLGNNAQYSLFLAACNEEGCGSERQLFIGNPRPPGATLNAVDTMGKGSILYDDYVDNEGFSKIKTNGWSYYKWDTSGGAAAWTPRHETLAYGWGNLVTENMHFKDTCTGSFQYIFKRGAYGHMSVVDPDVGAGSILRRECIVDNYAAKTIYYKRLTTLPNGFSLIDALTGTWAGNVPNNVLNKDFELYGSLLDAENGANKWDEGIGVMRDTWQYFHVAWSIFTSSADIPYPLAGIAFQEGDAGCRQMHGPFDSSTKEARLTVPLSSPARGMCA